MDENISKKSMGRPRKHDRDQIGIDLIEWAKKDDSINFCKFCALKNIRPSKLTVWSNEDPDGFGEDYDIAKAYLGYRREEWLNSGNLHVKAYDFNACAYDYFMAEEKRNQMTFEASLKKDDSKQISSINFKVNYAPGTGNSVEILPEDISTQDSTSTR
jgi:hypothetical protein